MHNTSYIFNFKKKKINNKTFIYNVQVKKQQHQNSLMMYKIASIIKTKFYKNIYIKKNIFIKWNILSNTKLTNALIKQIL